MIGMGIPEKLKALRLAADLSQPDLAKRAGVSQQLVSQLENGRNLTTKYLPQIARALGVGIADLDESYSDIGGDGPVIVTIAGKAGAGPDGSVLFATGDGGFGEVEAPMGADANSTALLVEGQSMRGMADDGSLVFYDGREPPNETHIGELCICWLEDERVLIKYPYIGSLSGLWNLESTTAPTLRDVPVRWFAHVVSVVPRRAATKLIRKRPDVQPVDVQVSR